MTERRNIDPLIINSPHEEPKRYWRHNGETRNFSLVEGRRPAGCVAASESSKSFDDPGEFIEIELVNRIRPRVKAWREAGYPGKKAVRDPRRARDGVRDLSRRWRRGTWASRRGRRCSGDYRRA